MNKFKQAVLTAGAFAVLAVSQVANAVPFTITAGAFTPGSGYGQDLSENGGTLLDVRFTTAGTFAPQNFVLDAVGEFLTFNFGSVRFAESNTNGGVNANERDGLSVTASFTFTNPLGVVQDIFAVGTATAGPVNDPNIDYTLIWNPVNVAFGNAGLFEIDLNDLSFSHAAVNQTQNATIKLLRLPTEVPEPGTVALLGLGLLGFAASRRKASEPVAPHAMAA